VTASKNPTSQVSQRGNVHAHSQIAVHFRFRCTPIRNTLPRSTHRAFWRLHFRACACHFSQSPQGSCVVTGCITTFTTQNLNLNGWNVGGAFKVLGPLALKGGLRRYVWIVPGANTHLKTYLIGPQLRFPGPISPFAHFLIGGAHESTDTANGPIITASPTRNAFATTLGGGLDLKMLPFISLRPIQIDYLPHPISIPIRKTNSATLPESCCAFNVLNRTRQ